MNSSLHNSMLHIFVHHNSITPRVLNYHCLLSIGKSTFWRLTYCWSVAPILVAAESFPPSLFLLECDRGVGVVFVEACLTSGFVGTLPRYVMYGKLLSTQYLICPIL